jgi:hypothetical protein
MIANGIFGDGNVFNPAGGATGFSKIQGSTLPKYILASLFD